MSLAKIAFMELFPEKNVEDYDISLTYNNRFKPYNANVKIRGTSLNFQFSKKWKTVSKEIQMGLVQELLTRIFKTRKKSLNIDLYNNFMKNVHIAAPKTKSDPFLASVFDEVNERYFDGLLESTNLVWHNSTNRLGTYEFGSDTISMSEILKDDTEALAYVMYHEMLHKHLKFDCSSGRQRHHTKQFRDMEAKFENATLLEKRLSMIARKHKLNNKVKKKTSKLKRLFPF